MTKFHINKKAAYVQPAKSIIYNVRRQNYAVRAGSMCKLH